MPGRTFQFGVFEVNDFSREFRKHGVRIRVQEQPFQILLLLLDRPGDIVSRDEIRARLWPDKTFVDFDSAISNAVRKLREALGDNADNPRFIETLSRRGYRFIGQIAVESPAPVPPEPKPVKVVAIAAGALLLILGTAALWLWSRLVPDSGPTAPLPLTAASGWEAHPSFSPDGNQIVYAWAETATAHKSHVFVKWIGSGRPVQLTTSSNADFFPAWSPDGRSIAFIRVFGEGNAIYLIPPAGGSERKLADGHFYGPAYWSPDGRFLAVGDRKSANDVSSLYLLSVETGKRLRLTVPPDAKTLDQGPVFSPDGRTLLFARCGETFTCSLYLLDLSTGYRPRAAPRLFREENGDIRGSAWTRSGKELLYVLSNDAGANYHLMRIPVAAKASPERLLYAGEQLWFGVAVAPRNDRLAYIQSYFDQDIWQIQIGKPPQSFIASTRLEFAPQYSPDGKRVVFPSDRSGQAEIWVSDAQGANQVQLTNFEEHTGSPRWSPDGRSIVFDRHLKQGWHVFVMSPDGGQVRQLTTDDQDEMVPNWSGDGSWIYYASNRTGRFEIWKAAASGGKGTQVTSNGGWSAAESLDGGMLYYTKNLDNNDYSSALWARSIRGGDERMVQQSIRSRAFTIMKDGIYYVSTPAPDGSSSLRFYDFATGESHGVAAIKNFAGGLTVSPDRKTFLFCLNRRAEANVMIVDNFR